MKEVIFMLGLPGCGKTTFIAENKKRFEDFHIVSADDIRIKLKKYNPLHPELVHQEAVEASEKKMYEYAENEFNIIMDAGGINNNYTIRIINTLKEKDYLIRVIFIDTPVQICIGRNKERKDNAERFVPISSVIDKSYKLSKSSVLLKELADSFETISYFSNKNIFVDMDGTIAEYQDLIVDEYGNIDFVNHQVFSYAKPVMEVINKLEELSKTSNIHILSASPNSICNAEKIEWVNKYLPFIKNENIYFAGNRLFKHVLLEHLLKKLKIHPKDCTMIDDDHVVISNMKLLNIRTVHPSKFLSNY
jgi:predicted kinase